MINLVIIGCISGLSLGIVLASVRLLKGPTLFDRIIGFEAFSLCGIGILGLLGLLLKNTLLFDFILIFSLIGFFIILMLCYFLSDPFQSIGDPPINSNTPDLIEENPDNATQKLKPLLKDSVDLRTAGPKTTPLSQSSDKEGNIDFTQSIKPYAQKDTIAEFDINDSEVEK